jgi:glyoxylase-like metal-dependent hydrolase (beta-lactamase superfamily II)
MANLRATHRNHWRAEEPGLSSIQTLPAFAIGQRALLVETPDGNVLWDCLSLLDDATVDAIRAKGGLAAIAISHPHFYASMVEWARAFKAPVYLHEADRGWVMRPDPALRFWSGASLPLPGGLSLVHTGGHFEGSQVLHWPAGVSGKGALLAGDQPNLCTDRRWVTFMRSFPNYIPLAAWETNQVMATLRRLRFDRLYGWTPDRILRSDAKAALERSSERHLRALRGEHGVVGMPQT